jgi:hypothetical protein
VAEQPKCASNSAGDRLHAETAIMQKNFGIPAKSLGTEESTRVNWRRGSFRLWLLVSAAWVMGWFIYLMLEGIQGGLKPRDLLSLPVLLFGPPIALLLFGVAAAWAVRGFKDDEALKK